MGKIQRVLGILLIIALILFGAFVGNRRYVLHPTRVDIDKIKIIFLDSTELPTGFSYSFKLKNETGHTIKQNSVYLSFPIKKSNGSSENNFKVEATGNKIDIEPNEELTLNFFCQRENFAKNASLDTEHPVLLIKGFMDNVTMENHFEKYGGFESFSK